MDLLTAEGDSRFRRGPGADAERRHARAGRARSTLPGRRDKPTSHPFPSMAVAGALVSMLAHVAAHQSRFRVLGHPRQASLREAMTQLLTGASPARECRRTRRLVGRERNRQLERNHHRTARTLPVVTTLPSANGTSARVVVRPTPIPRRAAISPSPRRRHGLRPPARRGRPTRPGRCSPMTPADRRSTSGRRASRAGRS